jgi:TPR repeat protein
MRVAITLLLLATGVALVAGHSHPRVPPPPAAGADGGLAWRRLGFEVLNSSDPVEIESGMGALTHAAKGGQVEAAVSLGRIYLHGVPGVALDPTHARAWFVRAAATNHPSAAYYLGVMSQRGEGSATDPSAAARWFERAAQAGSGQAMFLLANAYRSGNGVQLDAAKAVALYESAASAEHAPAMQALALAYQHGELGLAPNPEESRRYAMEAEHALKHHREDFP